MEIETTSKTITNAQEIRELAHTVARQARYNHPQLEENFDKFVKASIEAPGYAKTMLRCAECDVAMEQRDDVLRGLVSSEEHSQNTKNASTRLSSLFRERESGDALNKKFMEIYPETWMKRAAIYGGLAEPTNGTPALCSTNKSIKITVYKMFKRTYKMLLRQFERRSADTSKAKNMTLEIMRKII